MYVLFTLGKTFQLSNNLYFTTFRPEKTFVGQNYFYILLSLKNKSDLMPLDLYIDGKIMHGVSAKMSEATVCSILKCLKPLYVAC